MSYHSVLCGKAKCLESTSLTPQTAEFFACPIINQFNLNANNALARARNKIAQHPAAPAVDVTRAVATSRRAPRCS